MPQPWERQPGETDNAFRAFQEYLALEDERSLSKLIEDGRVAVKRRQLERWSSQFSWVDRASAWEDRQAELVRQKLEKRRLAMAEKQSDVARAMLDKAKQCIKNVDPESMSPQDVARWVDVATKTERLALGESTDNVREEVHGSIDLGVVEQYSAEELREIALFEAEHPLQGAGAAESIHPAQADPEAGDLPPKG